MTIDRTAFLIRTHENNPHVQQLVCDLKEHVSSNVYLVCDESSGPIEFGITPKFSLSPEVISKWGFSRHPDDWGWFCGDYCYYVAAEKIEDFDYFCLIEADVYLGKSCLTAIKALLEGCESHALAAGLRQFGSPPRFSKHLALIGEDPSFGCIFPFTRVSRYMIAEMFDLRKRVQNHPAPLRVNDEAILATVAHKSAILPVNLYDFKEVFHPRCFATNPPHLFEAVSVNTDDKRAYHPVVALPKVLSRILSGEKKYSPLRLRRVLSDAPEHIRTALNRALECSRSRPRLDEIVQIEKTERLGCLIGMLNSYEPIETVDVGANPIEGKATYAHLIETGQANLVGFEPNTQAFEELNRSAAPNEHYYCCAIGKGDARDLHLTRHSGFSSVFRPDVNSADYLGFRRDMSVTSTETLQTYRLDDLNSISHIDFLKIDIQGGELDVIANARQKLADALVVQTEVRFFPLYEDEPSFGDLEQELREQGFLLHSFDFLKSVLGNQPLRKKFRRRAFSQVVDGDAFFVKDLRSLSAYSSIQLSQLCVLADNVMGAFDLACLCLEELHRRGNISQQDADSYFSILPNRLKR